MIPSVFRFYLIKQPLSALQGKGQLVMSISTPHPKISQLAILPQDMKKSLLKQFEQIYPGVFYGLLPSL